MFNNKIKAINPVEYAKGIVANKKIRFDDSNGEQKYFAKYLPVDGDIQVGDWFLVDGPYDIAGHGNIMRCIKVLSNGNVCCDLCGQTHQLGYYRGYVKKVKLFLCSRDIQVGDTLFHIPTYKYVECKYESVLNKMKEKEFLEKYIKVVGEISPEAVWVKEGDTFNNDEIKQHIVPVKAGFEKYYDTEHQEEMERDVYEVVVGYYKIKGSCGYFH